MPLCCSLQHGKYVCVYVRGPSSRVLAVQIVFQINQDQAQPRAQMVSRDDQGKEIPVEKVEVAKKPYQFLWVSILREYLAFEFKPEGPLSFEWDQERVYDDFGETASLLIIVYNAELLCTVWRLQDVLVYAVHAVDMKRLLVLCLHLPLASCFGMAWLHLDLFVCST